MSILIRNYFILSSCKEILFAKANGIVCLELTPSGANVTSRIAAKLYSDGGVKFDMHRGHLYWATLFMRQRLH